MLLLTAALGALIGLSLGALGGGGSILTVPALVYVLGQSPAVATTGSLVIVGVTALAGSVAAAREGRVRLGRGVAFGLLGTAGSYLGSRLSVTVDPAVLLAAFSGLMLVAAAAMLVRERQAARSARARARVGGGDQPEAGVDEPILTLRPDLFCHCPRAVKVLATATVVGLVTGFFGVGGGFVVVPALVLALGFPMPVAVGTSLVVIAVNSATALAARLGHGVGLDWAVLLVLTTAAVLGSLGGSRLAGRVRPEVLTRAFVVLLLLLAGYTAARSLPALLSPLAFPA